MTHSVDMISTWAQADLPPCPHTPDTARGKEAAGASGAETSPDDTAGAAHRKVAGVTMSQMLVHEHRDRVDPSRLERHLPELLQQYVPDTTPLAALPQVRSDREQMAAQTA